MEILNINVERDDGDSYCGTLVYREGPLRGNMLWSLELSGKREVQVEIYPCESCDSRALASAEDLIVERILSDLVCQMVPC